MPNSIFYKFHEVKKKIYNRKLTIGSWLQLSSPDSAYILSNSNFEWLVIDMEHGSISLESLKNINRSILLGNAIPFTRVKSCNKTHIQEALDAGSLGIIIPNIKDKTQIETCIKNSKYPPSGTRGVGFCNANIYGVNFKKYNSYAQSPLVFAMIECKVGLNNIYEIVKCKGLHGILIGPYDLSASLKITGEFNNKIFLDAVKKVLDACKKQKISVGLHQVKPSLKELKKLIKQGFNFLPYSIDTVFLQNQYPSDL